MGSWAESRTITKQTWGVVKANPYMLLFPVMAGVVGIVVVLVVGGAGLAILGVQGAFDDARVVADGGDLPTSTVVTGVIVLIIAAYLATLVTQICMAGLVHCANEEMHGRDSSFGSGLAAAFAHLPALLGWAAIQTLVGWLLSMIQGNGGDNIIINIIRLVLASLAAVVWSVISFFVLPMIMLRGKGPISGIKESVGLIRQTWGKQIAGGVRLGGMVFLIAFLPALVLMGGGIFAMVADKVALGAPLVTLGVIVLLAAQALISALRAVFSVALLHYAEDQQAIGPFQAAELQAAVRVKS